MRFGTTAFPPERGASSLETLFASLHRGQKLGIDILNAPLPGDLGAGELARLRDELGRVDIEFEPTCPANYCTVGDEARRQIDRLVGALNQANQLGVRRIRTMARREINRFTKDPPLAEQLDRIVATLRPVAVAAAELGIEVALENHCDYRGAEIAAIIRAVAAPNLGAALDTGNAFTSFEDPLDAARALAPLARTTHLKDFLIAPLGIAGQAPWIPVGCALGEGNVDLPAIVHLLAQSAPDPATLPLIVEVNWPPAGQDTAELMVRSLDYIRRQFGDYLQS